MQRYFKIAITLVVLQALFLAGVYAMEWEVMLVLETLGSAWFFLPNDFLRDALNDGDSMAPVLASLYVVAHGILFSAASYYITYSYKSVVPRFKPLGMSELESNSRFKGGKPYRQIRHISSIKFFAGTHKYELEDLTPKHPIRIDEKPIEGLNATSPLSRLAAKGLAMLNAHKDVPAAVTGHHGDKSLYEHTINVMREYVRITERHKLAEAIAVFHDIGKLLVYSKKKVKVLKEDQDTPEAKKGFLATLRKEKVDPMDRFEIKTVWEKETNNHETASLMILNTIPEFWEIDEADRNMIRAVLKYKKGRLPRKYMNDPDIKMLISSLSFADGRALRQDAKDSIVTAAAASDFEEKLSSLLITALATANVNNFMKKDRSDGWTSERLDYVCFLLSNIKANMNDIAPDEFAKTLGLDVEYAQHKFHPFRSLAISNLRKLGLLLDEADGVKSNHGIYDIKSGKMPFHEVIVVNKAKLKDLATETLPDWGNNAYDILIKQNKTAIHFETFDMNDSEEDLTEEMDDLKKAILNVNKQG